MRVPLLLAIICVTPTILAAPYAIGETLCVGLGTNLRTSPCGTLDAASIGSERGVLKSIVAAHSCSLGNYTWLGIEYLGQGPIRYVAMETAALTKCGLSSVGKFIENVPYISQRYDVGDDFDGDWACGPTSTLMTLAHFGKLAQQTLHSSKPWAHTNAYGVHDSTVYKSPTGFSFTATQPDPHKKEFAGAWGSCTKEGGAWAYLIQDFVRHHGGLSATFYPSTNFTLIKEAIDRNHLVIQSTQVRGAGHLVVDRGYTTDGRVIVNDPWGDANLVHWGPFPNGEAATYSMATLAAKWCVVVAPMAEVNDMGETVVDPSPDAPRTHEAWVPFNTKPFSEY